MALQMGGAHIDENGNITGGKSGDQTGKEVCRRDWYVYSKGWDFVAIHPDADVREKHAQAVEQACDNDNVGYDQTIKDSDGRNTLYKQAKLVDWIIKNIVTPCECDCSSLQDVAAICSGGVSPSAYGSNGPATSDMRAWLKSAGYKIVTASKYLSSSAYSVRGGIYVSEGHHTECALGNGSSYKEMLEAAGVSDSSSTSSGTTGSTTDRFTYIVGNTYILQCDLAVRKGPKDTYDFVGYSGLTDDGKAHATDSTGYYLKKGTKVTCKEIIKTDDGEVWLKVPSGYMCGYDSKKIYINSDAVSTSSSGNTGSTGSTSSNRPTYVVGNTYTLQCNLAVRKSPSKDADFVGYKGLTNDGKKHATDSTGYYLKSGTKVTCKGKVQKSSTETWIKTPSGYMCGFDSSQVYIK